MRAIAVVLLAASAIVNAALPPSLPDFSKPVDVSIAEKEDAQVVPDRFIVEFKDPAGLRKRARGGNHFREFFRELKREGIDAKPNFNFSSALLEGASFRAPRGISKKDIERLPDVKRVWPVTKVSVPDFKVHSVGPSASSDVKVWTNHAKTGVLELHKRGIKGKGVVVGVIDSGTDYLNPAFGGGIGEAYTVIGGTDLVGDDYNHGPYSPDSDPMDCFGHGTHVSGIVAGKSDLFIGVAPEAKIRSFKVFGCKDGTTNDVIIEAFIQAYEAGVDIITGSLGGPSGWPNDLWASINTKLADLGVFVSIASGNAGDMGAFNTGSGNSGRGVVSVNSIENEQLFAWAADVTVGGKTYEVPYVEPRGNVFNISGTMEVVPISRDINNIADACNSTAPITANLTGKVALIRRGGCTFGEKEKNAAAAGAEYILFYNGPNQPEIELFIENPIAKQFAMITYADGVRLVQSSGKITAKFPKTKPRGVTNQLQGGTMSEFTNWGPTWEAQIKGEISAPGGNILSAYPMKDGGVSVASGTSMACPYVAGIAALYMGQYGNRLKLGPAGVKELRERIITSGTPLNWNDGVSGTDASKIAPVSQQGSGYVNALKVIDYKTYVSPAVLELNDTANFIGDHNLKIKNNGKTAITVSVQHVPAATFQSFTDYPGLTDIVQTFPQRLINGTATVTVRSSFSIPAGGTYTLPVKFTPPIDTPTTYLPVYSGHLILSTSTGETHTVPYQGIHGNLRDRNIWNPIANNPSIFRRSDNASTDGILLSNPAAILPEHIRTFIFGLGDRFQFQYFNFWGSAEIRVDVYVAGWTPDAFYYPPQNSEAFVGSISTSGGVNFPRNWIPRSDPAPPPGVNPLTTFVWTGKLADGKDIPNGKYVIDMRALRVSGDKKKKEDWIRLGTPIITIQGQIIKPTSIFWPFPFPSPTAAGAAGKGGAKPPPVTTTAAEGPRVTRTVRWSA